MLHKHPVQVVARGLAMIHVLVVVQVLVMAVAKEAVMADAQVVKVIVMAVAVTHV